MDIFLRPEVSKVQNRNTQHAKAGVVEKIADLIFEFGRKLDDSTLLVKFLIQISVYGCRTGVEV